eukprot:TRINITY_DN17741_c0_g1_i1.p1 TRINITY_DN17741_c0_g1~~TRINITY_DN17741_c0_g1_i1.p1  ORF type:complete len:183 (+),score=29.86 TRINITY_DN17741_c0_g1_i1:2-550(+)
MEIVESGPSRLCVEYKGWKFHPEKQLLLPVPWVCLLILLFQYERLLAFPFPYDWILTFVSLWLFIGTSLAISKIFVNLKWTFQKSTETGTTHITYEIKRPTYYLNLISLSVHVGVQREWEVGRVQRVEQEGKVFHGVNYSKYGVVHEEGVVELMELFLPDPNPTTIQRALNDFLVPPTRIIN